MRANRAKDTGPELTLRHELAALGVRGYRVSPRDIPGRPDLVFTNVRLAVFVHGCFWHRCPRCRLPLPKTHTGWWKAKFLGNRERDASKEALLRKGGWRVLTIWECEIRKDADGCARRVRSYFVRGRVTRRVRQGCSGDPGVPTASLTPPQRSRAVVPPSG